MVERPAGNEYLFCVAPNTRFNLFVESGLPSLEHIDSLLPRARHVTDMSLTPARKYYFE